MNSVNAKYFDGHKAQQQAITLCISAEELELHGTELIRKVPLGNVRISAKLGNSPRLLHFPDGGHCEVIDHAEFQAMLAESGIKPHSFLSHLEDSWRHAITATLLAIAFVIALFYWGLPFVANIAAARIPTRITQSIDTHFLNLMNDKLMQPSKLSTAQQQALMKKFDSLQNENGIPAHQLEFRSSKDIGANAFALPGGTIIITDQLINLATNDEEILAVLTHELGHVEEKHPLRQLLQSSAVGLAMTWYLGDVSMLLAAAPTLLLETSYSRNFESRADHYAASMLKTNNISPSRLADILEKLEKAHSNANKSHEKSSWIAELFSTHPDTSKRINELRSDIFK
jgi:Zn-dependent protease with chaperone function